MPVVIMEVLSIPSDDVAGSEWSEKARELTIFPIILFGCIHI